MLRDGTGIEHALEGGGQKGSTGRKGGGGRRGVRYRRRGLAEGSNANEIRPERAGVGRAKNGHAVGSKVVSRGVTTGDSKKKGALARSEVLGGLAGRGGGARMNENGHGETDCVFWAFHKK